MKIRKPSIAVLSSSPREKVSGGASSTGGCHDNDYEEKVKKKDSVLPLVAAAAAAAAETDLAVDATPGRGRPEIHTRPAHNWRNVLLSCNAQRETVQAGQEGEKHKPNYRSNGILRIREDKMRLLTSEGACVKEDKSGKGQREMVLDVPKLGLLEKSLASIGHVKKKRSRAERSANCDFRNAIIQKDNERRRDDDKLRKEIIEQDNGRRRDEKSIAGSDQCRRRNGRGWRCPERTVVGYNLCEHHLGKGRLRCINGNQGVVVNSKGTKFKELRLIEAACKREDHHHHSISEI